MLQDQKKERITIHRNHLVPYYLKENNIREELQNYLLDKHVPTLKQPKKNCHKNTDTNKEFKDHKSETKNSEKKPYNL